MTALSVPRFRRDPGYQRASHPFDSSVSGKSPGVTRSLALAMAITALATPALPHDGGLQPQAEAAPAVTAPKEAVQALGTHLAEGSGLGR